jgi:hypothetical protein
MRNGGGGSHSFGVKEALPAKQPPPPSPSREQTLLHCSLSKRAECGRCGPLYCVGGLDDRAAHAKHCDPHLREVPLLAAPWRSERVVWTSTCHGIDESRIIDVRRSDPACQRTR